MQRIFVLIIKNSNKNEQVELNLVFCFMTVIPHTKNKTNRSQTKCSLNKYRNYCSMNKFN